MTKKLLAIATLCCASMFAAPSAIEGRWAATVQSKRASQAVELNLQAQDNRLIGDLKTVSGPKNKEHTIAIENGSITDGHFTFTTVRTTKKRGTVKFIWDGTLKGDQLQGTRMREGAKRGIPFTAQRS